MIISQTVEEDRVTYEELHAWSGIDSDTTTLAHLLTSADDECAPENDTHQGGTKGRVLRGASTTQIPLHQRPILRWACKRLRRRIRK